MIPNEIKPIIRRADMPQIDTKLYPRLFVYLDQYKIRFAAGLIDPRKLYYHQDVNFDRANAIPEEVLKEPVLISHEHAIFDGNHRSYAHVVKEILTPYIMLHVPFKTGLQMIRAFPQVKYEAAA